MANKHSFIHSFIVLHHSFLSLLLDNKGFVLDTISVILPSFISVMYKQTAIEILKCWLWVKSRITQSIFNKNRHSVSLSCILEVHFSRADWLVKLWISCAIYIRASREKMASWFASVCLKIGGGQQESSIMLIWGCHGFRSSYIFVLFLLSCHPTGYTSHSRPNISTWRPSTTEISAGYHWFNSSRNFKIWDLCSLFSDLWNFYCSYNQQ